MTEEMNLLTILWQSGFVVKIVLLLLIGFSVLSWAIIIQKRRQLKEVESANFEFSEYFKNHTVLSEIYEKADEFSESSQGLMFKKGYLELNKIKDKLNEEGGSLYGHFKENGFQPLERALKQGANISIQRYQDKLSILASVSSVCPFIGLFGTVWGIIDSFTGLATGGGSIEAVAPGIAEALVATAVGLAAAIPANWFYNIFSNQIAKINDDMEAFGQDFLNTIERNFLIGKK